MGVKRRKAGRRFYNTINSSCQVYARLQAIRAKREAAKADAATAALAAAAAGDTDLLPKILECVEAHVTVGQISHTLRKV